MAVMCQRHTEGISRTESMDRRAPVGCRPAVDSHPAIRAGGHRALQAEDQWNWMHSLGLCDEWAQLVVLTNVPRQAGQ